MVDLNSFIGGISGGATVAIIIKAVDEYSATFEKTKTEMNTLNKAVAAAAVAFLAYGVQQAAEAETLAQRARFIFKENADTILDFAQLLSQKFAPSAEEITAEFSSMALAVREMGMSLDQQKQLMVAALTISAASGKNLNEVILDLTRGIQGNGRGLKEYGIIVNDATTSQDVFNQVIALSTDLTNQGAVSTNNAAKEWAMLTKEFKNMAQLAGEFLIPILKFLFQTFKTVTEGIAKGSVIITEWSKNVLLHGMTASDALERALFDVNLALENQNIKLDEAGKITAAQVPILNAYNKSIHDAASAVDTHTNSLVGLEAQALKTVSALDRLAGTNSGRGLRNALRSGQMEDIGGGVFVSAGNPDNVRFRSSTINGRVNSGINWQPTPVNDFILTKEGRLLETSPMDTLVGTKNPGGLGGNVNITIHAHDSRDVAEKVSRILADRFFVSVSG